MATGKFSRGSFGQLAYWIHGFSLTGALSRKPAHLQVSRDPLRRMEIQEKVPLLPHRPGSGQKVVLVIHGGAGTMSRATSTPERQALYKMALKAALEAGYAVLREGGEAMDAAVAAVTVMEGRHSR